MRLSQTSLALSFFVDHSFTLVLSVELVHSILLVLSDTLVRSQNRGTDLILWLVIYCGTPEDNPQNYYVALFIVDTLCYVWFADSLVDHATVEFNGSLSLDGTLQPCGSLCLDGTLHTCGSLNGYGALL